MSLITTHSSNAKHVFENLWRKNNPTQKECAKVLFILNEVEKRIPFGLTRPSLFSTRPTFSLSQRVSAMKDKNTSLLSSFSFGWKPFTVNAIGSNILKPTPAIMNVLPEAPLPEAPSSGESPLTAIITERDDKEALVDNEPVINLVGGISADDELVPPARPSLEGKTIELLSKTIENKPTYRKWVIAVLVGALACATVAAVAALAVCILSIPPVAAAIGLAGAGLLGVQVSCLTISTVALVSYFGLILIGFNLKS